MGIQIISISHKIAPLHVREMFAFTKEQQESIMKKMVEQYHVSVSITFNSLYYVPGQYPMIADI